MPDPLVSKPKGLFRAIMDAIQGENNRLGGLGVTRLTTPLTVTEVGTIDVESTLGFGEFVDGSGNGLIIIGGELIQFTGRTDTTFTGLTRALEGSQARFHQITTLVYDFAQNTSAVDHVRRGFLVNFALNTDLDVIGRNLGVDKCFGITESQWREIIKRTAYMPKQPLDSFRQVLDVVFPGQYDLIRRISEPWTVRVNVAIASGTGSKRGRFFLNGSELQLTTGLTTVLTDFPIIGSPFTGQASQGFLRIVSGVFLVDGETFILDDGVNPAVTFEYDDDASVVPGPTLRAVVFTAADSEATIRDAIIAAIAGAPTLDMTASTQLAGAFDENYIINLLNDTIGVTGNEIITETVVDPIFAVTGMSGGLDVGSIGVLGVFDDTPLTRRGWRGPTFTNYFTGGSFVGSTITLGTSPGAIGAPVLVDYGAFAAHYLAADENVVQDADFYPYLSDDTALVQCLLDIVEAAGIRVLVGIKP